MGFLESVKAWFKAEAAELKDSTDRLESRLDDDLSRRERQLNETPTEAMDRLQREIADSESSFADIEDQIGGAKARADAVGDLADADRAGRPADDIMDLDSEEITDETTGEAGSDGTAGEAGPG